MIKNPTLAIFLCAAAFLLAAPAMAETKPKREPTPAQLAARERMAKCSAEWKDAKAKGTVAKDAKWPQFWSACNARLKGSKT